MPLYEYRCDAHVTELVRPLGTNIVPCPDCGQPATRSAVNHTEIIGPTVNTLRMIQGATQAMAEREHIYRQAEDRRGESIARPNDWAQPHAEARDRVRRGEFDARSVRESTGETILGRR